MLMGALKRVLYNKNYLWYTFFNLFLTLFHHFTLNLLERSSACFILLLFIMLLILLSLLSLIFQTLNFFVNLFRISLTLKFIIFRTILSANPLLLITNTKWQSEIFHFTSINSKVRYTNLRQCLVEIISCRLVFQLGQSSFYIRFFTLKINICVVRSQIFLWYNVRR